MIVGVMADTHDQLERIDAAVAYFRKKKVEHVIHAGDFVAPFSVKRLAALGCPVTAVYGNNDGEVRGIRKSFGDWGKVSERVARVELGGRRIIVMHEPDFLDEIVACGMYEVAVTAHTHEARIESVGKCLVINPGSCGGVPDPPATCVLLDLSTLKAEVREL